MVRAGDADEPSPRGRRFSWWRVVPFGILALATLAFFASGLHRYLTFEEIGRHRDALAAWRERHEVWAVLAFLAVYTLAVSLSLPGAIWLTVCAGFLFGAVAGTFYAVVAATIGACTVFLAARYMAGDALRRRAGPAVQRMERGFRENALSYLLVLRLLPIFPFWLVNLVPAFLGVPLRTFAFGTLLGIIPGSIVYTLLGSGLEKVIDSGGEPDLGIIFQPHILVPLLGLAILAVSPIVYRRLKGGRPSAGEES
jgi:uncharacterized membrane protein YdjX (TVP38/TMEM64 family)